MQRDLVEDRRWISRQDYLDGLALAQLAPGPLAAQLAIPRLRPRWRAGRHDGLGLLHPAVVSHGWAISVAYVRFGGLAWMQALLRRRRCGDWHHRPIRAQADAPHLARDALLWTIAAVMALTTAWIGARDRMALRPGRRADRRPRWLAFAADSRSLERRGAPRRFRARRPGGRCPARSFAREHLLAVRQGRRICLRQRPRHRSPSSTASSSRRTAGSTTASFSMLSQWR